jgi:hypothetical protein
MAAALAVLVAVLASFGPIVAFFSVTSTSYPFILLLTVAVFFVAGGFGIHFLWRTIVKLTIRIVPARTVASGVAPSVEPSGGGGFEVPESSSQAAPDWAVIRVFAFWMVAFALVGMQMSWVLRPFIGSPRSDFTWFRPRQDSFFEAVAKAVHMLFFGS